MLRSKTSARALPHSRRYSLLQRLNSATPWPARSRSLSISCSAFQKSTSPPSQKSSASSPSSSALSSAGYSSNAAPCFNASSSQEYSKSSQTSSSSGSLTSAPTPRPSPHVFSSKILLAAWAPRLSSPSWHNCAIFVSQQRNTHFFHHFQASAARSFRRALASSSTNSDGHNSTSSAPLSASPACSSYGACIAQHQNNPPYNSSPTLIHIFIETLILPFFPSLSPFSYILTSTPSTFTAHSPVPSTHIYIDIQAHPLLPHTHQSHPRVYIDIQHHLFMTFDNDGGKCPPARLLAYANTPLPPLRALKRRARNALGFE